MATVLCYTSWDSSTCYPPPRTNLIQPPSTELLHFLIDYVTCFCNLDLWPSSPKLGHMLTTSCCWIYGSILKFIERCVFEICCLKFRFRGPLLGNRCCQSNHSEPPLVGRSSSCQPPRMRLMRPPSTELYQFLTAHVTWPCDLDLIESYYVMPHGWSIPIPSLNWIWLTVPESGRL